MIPLLGFPKWTNQSTSENEENLNEFKDINNQRKTILSDKDSNLYQNPKQFDSNIEKKIKNVENTTETIKALQKRLKDTSLLSVASLGINESIDEIDNQIKTQESKNPFSEEFLHESNFLGSPNHSIPTQDNSLLNPKEVTTQESVNQLKINSNPNRISQESFNTKLNENNDFSNSSFYQKSPISQSSKSSKGTQKDLNITDSQSSKEISHLFVNSSAFKKLTSKIDESKSNNFISNIEEDMSEDTLYEAVNNLEKKIELESKSEYSKNQNFRQTNEIELIKLLSPPGIRKSSNILEHSDNLQKEYIISENSSNISIEEEPISFWSHPSIHSVSTLINRNSKLHPFQKMYKDELYTDVSFTVDRSKKIFKCHTCIVSQSKYLRERLRKKKKRVELPGMDETTVEMLIQLMYGFQIDFDQFDRKTYQKLIVSAKYYNLMNIENYLSKEYSTRFLDQKNIISIIKIAEEKKLKFLRKYAIDFLSQNFQSIKNNKKIQESIDRELLWEILNSILHANSINDTQFSKDSIQNTQIADVIQLQEIFDKHIKTLHKICIKTESNPISNRILVRCNDDRTFSVDLCLLKYYFTYFREIKDSEVLIPLPHHIFESVLDMMYNHQEEAIFLDNYLYPEILLCGLIMLQWSDEPLYIRDHSNFNIKLLIRTMAEYKISPPKQDSHIFKSIILPLLTPSSTLDILWDTLNLISNAT